MNFIKIILDIIKKHKQITKESKIYLLEIIKNLLKEQNS